MSRSKKIFLAFAAMFFLLLAFVVYDISSRTTFPGSRPDNSVKDPFPQDDTLDADSAHRR